MSAENLSIESHFASFRHCESWWENEAAPQHRLRGISVLFNEPEERFRVIQRRIYIPCVERACSFESIRHRTAKNDMVLNHWPHASLQPHWTYPAYASNRDGVRGTLRLPSFKVRNRGLVNSHLASELCLGKACLLTGCFQTLAVVHLNIFRGLPLGLQMSILMI